ncbi:ammonium transporter [Micromonospora echinospora]|uniref:ammonium transporter n=1 Tax=Micromonospora echinospora TaxID=1877 RepID=UPI003A87364F
MTAQEIPLHGGNVSTVVRVGDTVRRNAGPWTPAVHALLRHLEYVGFTGAPRAYGMDERNREVLSYLEGECGEYPLAPHWVTDEALVTVATMLRFIGAGLGALDFAGGTAVHINAGAAALALVLVLGKRLGWPKEAMKPHNVPMVALGTGLLWFGWFGFNAGSELTADATTAIAFLNTQVCTAAAVLGWLVVEKIRDGRPTLVGASSGAIAGLVAITPACAFVAPWAAVLLGVVAGAVCALAVGWKYKLGYDDSLDVVGVHFVGGWIGCLWIGLFGTSSVSSLVTDEGLFYGGGLTQLGVQALSALIVTAYSFAVAFALGFVIQKTIGFRVSAESEVNGIDIAEHAESGYDLSPSTGSAGGAFAMAGIGTPTATTPPKAEPAPTTGVGEKVAG